MSRKRFVNVGEGVFRDPAMPCFSVRLDRWIRYRDTTHPMKKEEAAPHP